MKKAGQILIIYLVSLMLFSLFFSYIGIKNNIFDYNNLKIQISPIILVTIIGGIIALKYTVNKKAFKLFLLIYACLWIVRYMMIYTGNQLGEIYIGQRKFRFDLIVANYYENISRITTPLPFILFWFVNFLFLNHNGKAYGGNKVD